MQLYNKLSADERKALIEKAGKSRITISFYQYIPIENPKALRDHLFLSWDQMDVLGRIYVANEGYNAQLSVPADQLEAFKAYLDSMPLFQNIRLNVAVEQDNMSFLKLRIKVREKIVADGLEEGEIDLKNGGKHVDAEEFNALISDPNTVLVDMRNHYESEVGHFENAITPDVDTFRESLPKIADDIKEHKNKNLVMYCTGGIRCEKASAYFRGKGFRDVYQLNGGIIEYTRQVREKGLENKFKGVNFVFDNRMAERISEDIIAKCHQCGAPCDTHTNCTNVACNLLFIQCPSCAKKMEGACSTECKTISALPHSEQKALRKGKIVSNKIYKKGRWEPEKLSEFDSE